MKFLIRADARITSLTKSSPCILATSAAAVWVLLCGTLHPAAAGDGCPQVGAVYRPNPEDPDARHVYRLRIQPRRLPTIRRGLGNCGGSRWSTGGPGGWCLSCG